MQQQLYVCLDLLDSKYDRAWVHSTGAIAETQLQHLAIETPTTKFSTRSSISYKLRLAQTDQFYNLNTHNVLWLVIIRYYSAGDRFTGPAPNTQSSPPRA